jgi:hypothetical protein
MNGFKGTDEYTSSMEQTPSGEANSRSASQQVPAFTEPEVSLPCSQLVSVMSHMNPICTLPPSSNTVLPSTPKSSERPLPYTRPDQIL